MTTPIERLNRISEQGLCIGCGMCQSVAGTDQIEVVRTPDGALRPVPTDRLTDESVDRVYRTCPGTRLEGLPETLTDAQTKRDLVWGAFQRIAKAHAADPEIRFKAAAGGVLTALAVFLIESGEVDFIVHARMPVGDPELGPSFGVRHVSRTRDDVLAGAGSRYGPTATLIDIKDQLAKERPFAFIGTPCDIAAIRNLAQVDDRVDRYCRYMLTPVCGGFMQTPALEKALTGFGLNFDRLTMVRYRGHGCPGPTRLEQDDGTVLEKTYLDFWADESAWGLPWRCKVCADGIGEAADIAAADCWPGGSPTVEQAEDHHADPGSNGVLIRSTRGERLWRAAVAAGAIVEESQHTARDMDDWQPHQVRRKQAVQSRYDALSDAGRIVPVTQRLRLKELQASVPADVRDSQRHGTAERIRIGKADEPTPVKRAPRT